MARDDSWLMGALAAQDAYRGEADFPPPPAAPVSVLRTGELPRTYESYLAEATAPRAPDRLVPPPASPIRGQIGTAGRAVGGALAHPFVQAGKALRGEMTEREAQDFAFESALLALGPGAGRGAVEGARALGRLGKDLGAGLWDVAGQGVRMFPEGVGAFGGRLPPGRRLPPLPETPNPRAVMGGNMPPPEFALAKEPVPPVPPMPEAPGGLVEPPAPPPVPEAPAAPGALAEPSWAAGLPRARPAARSVDVPNIRGLPVDEAIDIARRQPHLIPAGERSEGYYIGGPRNVQSKRDLNRQRAAYDAQLAADPRGWDWYERYRPALNLSTGGVPAQNQFAGAQHGQWSAGVDPNSELHYVLKELNSSIAGMPERANYGAQHRAHLAAIAANDPSLYQLADKTEEYANQVTRGLPGGRPLIPGATGVVDFRNLREWGYTEPSGEPQKGAPGAAAHRFVDMETALAIDRANRLRIGGKTDWTGEQLQAAPWVRQKAQDLMSRNPRLTYEEAFQRANRTIADFYPFKTYNATYEAQPGADVVGHMPGSVAAGPAEREEFFAHPASTWATAPMGRDAIYAGLGSETAPGNMMRVLPTVPMSGMYKTPGGVVETNPGEVAQPLGTFQMPREYEKGFIGPRDWEPFKRTPDQMRAIMNAGEHLRALIDAQNAGSWHKFWEAGPLNQSTSLLYSKPEGGRQAIADLLATQQKGEKFGLGDVTDSARGSLVTRFWPPLEGRGGVPQIEDPAGFNRAYRKGEFDVPGLEPPARVRLDSDLADLVGEWQKQGTGAATSKVLSYINTTPEMRWAFNNNPYLAERALAKFERDKAWAGRWGAPREDIQNLRQLVATGPGWIDKVEAAIKNKSISLPSLAALLAGAAALHGEGSDGGL